MTTGTTIFLHTFNLHKDLPPPPDWERFNPTIPDGWNVYGGIHSMVPGVTPESVARGLGEQAGATLAMLSAIADKSGGILVYEAPDLEETDKAMTWRVRARILKQALTES